MSNKSVSDFVAATMDAVLKSESHQSLFGAQYKFASDENDAKSKCVGCGCAKDSCKCSDSMMADDNYARKTKNKEDSKDSDSDSKDSSSSSKDSKDSGSSSKDSDSSSKDSGSSSSNTKKEAAFAVAIDSLLSASAALDAVGMEKTASLSLKLASLVIKAKKKEQDSKKSDSNMAKEKAAKEKAKAEKAKAEKAEKAKAEKAKAEKVKAKAKADTQAAKDKLAKEKAAAKAKVEKDKAKASKK